MLLDPEQPVRRQLEQLSGRQLERAVAAIVHFLGYIPLRNVHYVIEGQEITEFDVLALRFMFNEEFMVAIECTGRPGSEFLKFASAFRLIRPRASRAYFVTHPHQTIDEDQYRQLCEKVEVVWLPKRRLLQLFAPITGAIPDKARKVGMVNKLMLGFMLEDRLLDLTSQADELRDFRRFLLYDVWRTAPATEQASRLYQEFLDKRTIAADIAKAQRLDFYQEMRTGHNELVQTALLLQYLGRLFTVIGVLRLAEEAAMDHDVDSFLQAVPGVLRETVRKLQENALRLERFATFFYHWTKIWGGMFWLDREEDEARLISEELHTKRDDISFFVELLQNLFQPAGREEGFVLERKGVRFFKLLPRFYQATGVVHRLELYGADVLREFPGQFGASELLNYYRAVQAQLTGLNGPEGYNESGW